MENNILAFTYKKSKHKYQIIAISVFVSIIILNILLQTMSVSIQTLHNEMLNSPKLSLILMQNYDDNNLPYNVHIDDIKAIKDVNFVSESIPLGLVGIDDSGSQEGFIIYAINPDYAYYVGIENLEDNKIYCSSKNHTNIDNYKIMDISSSIELVTYDDEPPMILSSACFISESSYEKIISELPSGYVEYMIPEYLIGINNVKNVFDVVKQLDNLYIDDNPMFMYQASGLEGLVEDTYILLIILIIVFILFIIFNIFIVFSLASSLVRGLSRDLMILYLNGMPRREISKQLMAYSSKFFNKSIVSASILSLITSISILQFQLNQSLSLSWLIIVALINLGVVIFNMITLKTLIVRLVRYNTSNKNISKVVRN